MRPPISNEGGSKRGKKGKREQKAYFVLFCPFCPFASFFAFFDSRLLAHERQPIAGRFFLARSDCEEFVLELRGDCAAFAAADLGAVNAADGRNLSGGAGEEDFVGD